MPRLAFHANQHGGLEWHAVVRELQLEVGVYPQYEDPETVAYWWLTVHHQGALVFSPDHGPYRSTREEAIARANEEVKRQVGMKIAELQAILDYLDAPEEAPEAFPYDIRPADTYGI